MAQLVARVVRDDEVVGSSPASPTNHMTDEKWEEVVGRIKDGCNILSHQTLAGELSGESTEEIVFESPAGTMKITRHTRPRLLEEKTHYSGRVGGSTGIERVYSEDEFVNTVALFKDVGGDWEPVDNSMFA